MTRPAPAGGFSLKERTNAKTDHTGQWLYAYLLGANLMAGASAAALIASYGGTTLAFVNSSTSVADTITIPANAQAGDLAVLFDFAWTAGVGVPSDVVPTGWTGVITGVQDAGANDARTRVSRKILSSGDPGASVTGMNGTENNKVMFVFRPNRPISDVTAGSWAVDNVPVDTSPQVVTTSGQPAPLIVLGMAASQNATAVFSEASPPFDATVSNASEDMIAGYKIYNSNPVDHTIDMADLGNANSLASGYLRVQF